LCTIKKRNILIKVNFVTHSPKYQGSPYIQNISDRELSIVLSDNDGMVDNVMVDLKPGEWMAAPYQYYINWKIKIWGPEPAAASLLGEAKFPLFEYDLNLEGQVVFIKMDAYALGDNLAWMPYVEEFRLKHGCRIICSTFWNDIFHPVYPDIMFVKPNTRIENIFAQYYIGTHDDTPPCYSPTTYLTEPLQKIAADILGLPYEEKKARVARYGFHKNPRKVCISQHASLDMKTWHGDWQSVVDMLVERGFEVHVISKEPTDLKGVIDKTGDIPIHERIKDLEESQYFIGVSSGLSWLAHSLDCHVFLISDFTPKDHEFSTNATRIYGPEVRKVIEYTPVEKEVSLERVLSTIKRKLDMDAKNDMKV
jgi:autotransporter strand-loop-strand O-heptosyltransferase